MSCSLEIPFETIVFNQKEWDKGSEYRASEHEMYVREELEYVEHDECPTFFTNSHYCQICNKTQSDNFIILNCNHTFHINCLANYHIGPYNQRSCAYCKNYIDDIELKYLHNKFCDNVNKNIININEKLDKLKAKIKKIQESIRQTEHHKQELILEQRRSQAIFELI